MTGTEAIAAIRASTLHDADTQVTDAQILVELEKKYRQLRRVLQGLIPSLYESVTTPTVASGASTIAKPTATDRIRLLEKLISGSDYYPVPAMDGLNRNYLGGTGCLSWYEQAGNIQLMPVVSAPGTYRLTVIANPAAAFVGATTLDVPDGCEDILLERVSAWVRQRHDDDYRFHLAEADRIWKEAKPHLMRRYGLHPVSGLAITRG